MDRFLTVHLAAPLRRLMNGHDSRLRIPILMYHAITDDPEPGVRGYYRLNTPPALFRRHLQILKDERFSVIDLPAAAELLVASPAARLPLHAGERAGVRCSDHEPSPDSHFPSSPLRYAVITFDDGFKDFATHAVPALGEFGFSATNFIITDSVGKRFKERECLSWQELRDLQSAGFSFGSHTVSHPKLWELDDTGLRRELIESRKTLEDSLGIPVDTFAHPYAFPRTDANYVGRFCAVLREAGYRVGVTTSLGCAGLGDDGLTLKRLPANGADDEALFRAKLLGAYDWLATPQALFKRLKQLRPDRAGRHWS